MKPGPAAPDEARYDLCIGQPGRFAKRSDATLRLTDEGIDYALDGRSGLRPYAGLKALRIQLFSPAPHLSALIQLDFIKGWPLVVHSSTLDGQIAEGRSRAFVDFLADLHRRLSPQDRARIVFRRGFSPVRHPVITIGAVVIAAPLSGSCCWLLWDRCRSARRSGPVSRCIARCRFPQARFLVPAGQL